MDKNKKNTHYLVKFKKNWSEFNLIIRQKVILSWKKRPYKPGKPFNKSKPELNSNFNQDNKKNFARKFIEQQATKDFIKKDNKPAGKSKLKLKGPVDKRDFKLTVSRALNVEEIEIKQRSLASVKRARLKEKKINLKQRTKKSLKKL